MVYLVKINKRTGPNKVRTGGKFDSKKINVPVRLLETREYVRNFFLNLWATVSSQKFDAEFKVNSLKY